MNITMNSIEQDDHTHDPRTQFRFFRILAYFTAFPAAILIAYCKIANHFRIAYTSDDFMDDMTTYLTFSVIFLFLPTFIHDILLPFKRK